MFHRVRLRRGDALRRCDPLDIAPFADSDVLVRRWQAVDFERARRDANVATQQLDHHVDDRRAEHGLQRPRRLRAEDAAALAARIPAIVLASDAADRRPSVDRAQLQRDCERVAWQSTCPYRGVAPRDGTRPHQQVQCSPPHSACRAMPPRR